MKRSIVSYCGANRNEPISSTPLLEWGSDVFQAIPFVGDFDLPPWLWVEPGYLSIGWPFHIECACGRRCIIRNLG
jgi:hypothetical protein